MAEQGKPFESMAELGKELDKMKEGRTTYVGLFKGEEMVGVVYFEQEPGDNSGWDLGSKSGVEARKITGEEYEKYVKEHPKSSE